MVSHVVYLYGKYKQKHSWIDTHTRIVIIKSQAHHIHLYIHTYVHLLLSLLSAFCSYIVVNLYFKYNSLTWLAIRKRECLSACVRACLSACVVDSVFCGHKINSNMDSFLVEIKIVIFYFFYFF